MTLRLLDQKPSDPLAPVKPWQRLACLLYANGAALRDIARELQRDLVEVTSFVTSERGKAILGKIIANSAERLDDLLRASAVDSLMTLVELRDTAENENVRSRCAIELLNKIRGTAPSAKELTKSGAEDFSDVEAEIAKLRKEVESKS